MNPFIICVAIPGLLSLGNRFIIQGMVEEKNNKMRESLRLMSLSPYTYIASVFLTYFVFAFISGICIAAAMQGAKAIFPDDPVMNPIYFGLCVFLFMVAQIPFCMAISTMF